MGSPDPWTADRLLDTAGAARAISEALPEFEGAEVRLLGQGWDFDAYEVERRFVFRFPRRKEEQARLRRDLVLLPWLGEHLAAPVPHYAWGALSAPSFPYIFSGYTKLPGVNLSMLDPGTVDLPALGHNLGALFRSLHALRPPADVCAALRRSSTPLADRHKALRRYLAPFQAAVDAPLAARAARFFDDTNAAPAEPGGSACIVHDDLHAEHILIAAADAPRVTGLLDWSDAALGDAAADFAGIYPWGGEPLLQAMLAAYGNHDPLFEARARFLGLCVAFIDFDHWTRVGRADGAAWTQRVLADNLP